MITREAGPSRRSKPAANTVRLRKGKTLKAGNTDGAIVGGRAMSADRTSDDADNADLPVVERDAVSTGAAADSADWDERLKGLSRLLRFAMLISDNASYVEQRLIAEINELCPNLPLNAAWAAAPRRGHRTGARRRTRPPCRHPE
jgi:hypothetical protein